MEKAAKATKEKVPGACSILSSKEEGRALI